MHEVDSFFGAQDVFNIDKGGGNNFNIAFGLMSYDWPDTEKYDFSKYATIKAQIRSWAPHISGVIRKDLPLKPCTRDELGIGDDGAESSEAKFYPPHERSKDHLNKYWEKLYCIDGDIDIIGDY